MVIEFTVSEQDACVQGHFPGAPVVPGAYLLAKVDLALRNALPELCLTGFTKVKFHAPLLPGCLVQLRCDYSGTKRLPVSITDGQIVLLQATALLR